jgi:hypothetical protein
VCQPVVGIGCQACSLIIAVEQLSPCTAYHQTQGGQLDIHQTVGGLLLTTRLRDSLQLGPATAPAAHSPTMQLRTAVRTGDLGGLVVMQQEQAELL